MTFEVFEQVLAVLIACSVASFMIGWMLGGKYNKRR